MNERRYVDIICITSFFVDFCSIDFRSDISYNTYVATEGGEDISEKKMGRPTDNPKTTMFRVRLDNETEKKLNEAAETLDITKSDVVRAGIDLVHRSLNKK